MRILIVNPFGIGDVLFTTPLIRAARRAFPDSRIGYLCNKRTERILRGNPHLDELFIYEKDEMVRLWRASTAQCLAYVGGLLRRIRRAQFDCVIDLSLSDRYAGILKLLGVRRRIGFDYRNRGRFLTERLPIDGYHDEHVVRFYGRLLRFMGIRPLDGPLDLRVADEDERWADRWLREHDLDGRDFLVGVVPAGGISWGIAAPFRRWSFENFAAVGDVLIDRYGARVLLFGEAEDAPLCRAVSRLMRRPVIDLSGQTTLGQFVSLLGRLGLVLCNDGGPLHLAVSRGVKTVSIFGPVDPVVYGPFGPAGRHRVVTKPLPCRPCYHQFKLPPCPYNRACLSELSVDDVLSAVEDMLGNDSSDTGIVHDRRNRAVQSL